MGYLAGSEVEQPGYLGEIIEDGSFPFVLFYFLSYPSNFLANTFAGPLLVDKNIRMIGMWSIFPNFINKIDIFRHKVNTFFFETFNSLFSIF